MKSLPVAALAISTAVALSAVVGCAGAADDSSTADSDVSSDPCRAKALNAAEVEYGNDPSGTSVKVLTKGKKYRVTVGINNAEDGPHDYYVTFATSCSSKAVASEVPSLAHPLRDASHVVYEKILSSDKNEMPSSYSTSVSSLPSAARKQLNTWNDPKHAVCTSVASYEVAVSGQKTYAITCVVPADSIKFDLAIYDATGSDIDEAAIYHTNDVGDNGVSWQNETFLEQD
jgi:hypothetical protein